MGKPNSTVPTYTKLQNDDRASMVDVVNGVHGIAVALNASDCFDSMHDDAQLLVCGLRELTKRLYDAVTVPAPEDESLDARTLYWGTVDRTENERLSDRKVAAELRRHQWDCERVLSAEDSEDGYRVSKTWTAKGIRHFLGERRFMEDLLYPGFAEGRDVKENEPLETCLGCALQLLDAYPKITLELKEKLEQLEQRLVHALDNARYEGANYDEESERQPPDLTEPTHAQ